MSSSKQAPNPRSLKAWRDYEAEVEATKANEAAKKARAVGRPRRVLPEDEICQRLANGESLIKICNDLDIPFATVFDRLRDPEAGAAFRIKYTRARETQCEHMVEKMIQIADGADERNAHAIRVQIETRRWIVSKLLAKKYGDKPADVTVETHVHNHISTSRQKELQERHAKALERT